VKQRYFLLFLIALVYLAGFFVHGRWKTTLLLGDSNGYYMHVVSFFVNQDVGDYDQTIKTLLKTNSRTVDARNDPFGIRLTDKGKRYIKYTLGVGVMETPFFFLGHLYAKFSNKYQANGWSLPYLLAVSLSTIFYLLIGFNLLIKSLQRYFPKNVTMFVVLGIALATNLYYHALSLVMAHGFLFFLYCLLIYLTIHFYEKPGVKKALGLGATVGLITLTRVPEVVTALVPLLWGIYSWESLKNRVDFLRINYALMLYATLSFLLVFSIQLVYWYYVSGKFIFNPYQGESFNFLEPNILKGWFYFKNGWLIYTPIMAFSLIGWVLLRRYLPEAQLAIFAVVGLVAYIHYSYYVWAYFPGLGSRPMVETYPLLAFGLAAFFMFCNEKKWLSWFPYAILVFFTMLNMFQTWQQNTGLIWTEHGNYAFYLESFGMTKPTIESLRAFDSGEIQPDSSKLNFVKNILIDDFESFSEIPTDSTFSHSGNFSLFQTGKYSAWGKVFNLNDTKDNDWLRVGIYAFMSPKHQFWKRNHSPNLIIEIYDDENIKRKWISLKLSSHIAKNKNYSIWHSGDTNIWAEAALFIKLPRDINSGWSFKAYIWNANQKKLYLDDFRVDLYEEK
jgi:hypothetical protein